MHIRSIIIYSMDTGLHDRARWTRGTLLHERDAGRIVRLVVGVAIYTAAALMLLS